MKLKRHQKIKGAINIEYKNIGHLFFTQADRNPAKIFLISPYSKKSSYTYSEIKERVILTENYLLNIGLIKGDRINIILLNSIEFLLLYLASLSLGITVVPINPELSSREMLYIIKNSQAKVVLYAEIFDFKIKEIKKQIQSLKIIKLHNLPNFEPIKKINKIITKNLYNPDLELTDEAVIIYTSGTTGNPKGVVLPHLNLLADTKAICNCLKFSSQIRSLGILPLFHNNGQVVTFLAPLFAGGTSVIADIKSSLMSFWYLVNKYKINWTSVMPSILAILLSLPSIRKDKSMKGIICAGQVLTRNIQNNFEKRFRIPIFEGFGLTETTSFACINYYPASKRKIGSIGKPIITNEMSIQNEKGKILDPYESGEICIRGLNVACEYLNLPVRNRTAFANGWFHSGDFGYQDKEGFFYFQCRKDFLIIKGGENIYPAEIENIFYEHKSVKECAVIGIPDSLLGENICAFVELKSNNFKTTSDELKKYLSGKIANFKQPKKIIITNNLKDLKEIPRGPTKKILYRVLEKYYSDHFQ